MQQQQPTAQAFQEEDWLYTVLCDLKRSAREYTTATTESNDPSLRQLFNELLNNTLSMQGQLYQSMKQQQMYNAPSPALRQDVQQQIQTYQKSGQQAMQMASQQESGTTMGINAAFSPSNSVSSPSNMM